MLAITLYRILDFYELLIIAWCIMSWFPRGNETLERIRETLGMVVEPYLALFRRFIPPMSGIDFSPIVAIVVLRLVQRGILYIL
ncbi:MAG: YggT family protein [Coriobacteriaceae bacterium]|nr:YggT family protein [Coriobacteriaceae bacterium]